MKIRVADVLPKIPGPPNAVWPEGVRSAVGLEHGSMQLRLFAPGAVDRQQPHTRDELYVIAAGSAEFVVERGGRVERFPCEAHDVLFVAAGDRHRFEQLSPDFKTWVVFYGPEGGEAGREVGGTAAPA